MLFRGFTLSTVLITLQLPGMGAAAAPEPCNPSEFLKKSLYFHEDPIRARARMGRQPGTPLDREPRSAWGKLNLKEAPKPPFSAVNAAHDVTADITVFQGSVGEKDPELIHLIDDLQLVQVAPGFFEKRVTHLTQAAPQSLDFLNYYGARKTVFQNACHEYVARLKKLNPELGNSAENLIDTHFKKVNELFVKVSPFDESAKAAMAEYHRRSSGLISELYALTTLPKVVSVGTKYYQIPEIESAIEEFAHKFPLSKEEFEKFKNEHSSLYSAALGARKYYQVESVSDGLIQMLKNRVANVVRKEDGTLKVVLVKKFFKRIELSDFKALPQSRFGQFMPPVKVNSMESQVNDELEIRNMLGLSKKVSFEYYAPNGVSQEVRDLLHSRSIEVVSQPPIRTGR